MPFVVRAFALATLATVVALLARASSRAAMPEGLRAVPPACAQPATLPLLPGGGTLLSRGCDGSSARLDYGPNSGRGTAVAQLRSVPAAGLRGPAGTIPVAAFELTAVSAQTRAEFAAPQPDRSSIASAGIARDAAYELVGYRRDARGALHLAYRSAVAIAVAPRLVSVSSPLAGATLASTTDVLFVLYELPAGAPSLTVTVQDNGRGTWTVGQPASQYTLAVGNAGTLATSGTLTVSDTLPAGLTLDGKPTGKGWTCSSAADGKRSIVTCTSAAAIGAHGSAPPLTLPVYVSPATKTGSRAITDTALAFGGGDPVHGNLAHAASGNDVTTILGPPGLDISLTDDSGSGWVVGRPGAAYTITVGDINPTATDAAVFVSDALPGGVTLAARPSGAGWNCDASTPGGTRVICTSTVPIAARSHAAPIVVPVLVGPSAKRGVKALIDTALTYGGGDPTHATLAAAAGNTDATTVLVQPALAIALSDDANGGWIAGQPGTTYTITVSNTGYAATTARVTLANTVVGAQVDGKITASGWTCSTGPGGNATSCTSTTAIPARGKSAIVLPVGLVAFGPKPGVVNDSVSVYGGGDPAHGTPATALADAVNVTVEPRKPAVAVYVADSGHHAVKEVLPAGAVVTLSSAFLKPLGIAVDGAGNVYVADGGDRTLKELAAGSAEPVVLASGFTYPTGVAVDARGDAYVADSGSGAKPGSGAVKEVPAGGGSPRVLAGTFENPSAVALDSAGNLYVADGSVLKGVSAATGAVKTLFSYSNGNMVGALAVDPAANVYWSVAADAIFAPLVKLSPGAKLPVQVGVFEDPSGIAVDAAGDVYADPDNTVAEHPAGGLYATIAAGLEQGGGMAVKPAATPALALAKTDNGPWRLGTNSTPPRYTIAVDNAGTAPTSGTITVTDALPTGLTLTAAPSGTDWTCTGAAGATTFTCTSTAAIAARTGSLPTAGKPIAVPVGIGATTKLGIKSVTNVAHAFGGGDPQHATAATALAARDATTVEREPDVNLYVSDESAHAIDEVTAGGTSQSTLATGFGDNRNIAVDGFGNVFVPDVATGSVSVVPAAGGTPTTLASNLSEPTGVAVDPSGNVYVTDFGDGTVRKIPAAGGTPTTVASGFSANAIALDAAGNLYIAVTFSNVIEKIPAGGGKPVAFGSGFSQPAGVAVDSAGNVYVTDSGHNAVKEVAAGGKVLTLATGLSNLQGIAVDAADDVYVAGAGLGGATNGVFEIPAGSSVPVAVGSGFSNPWGVAVKPAATPLLTLSKTDNGPWRPGTNPTPPRYTLAVGNAGTAPTSGTLTVTDTLPSGLTLTATPSGTGWNCTGNAGATSFTCTSTAAIAARSRSTPAAGKAIAVPVGIGAATKLGVKSITNVAHAFGGGDPQHATAATALGASDATTVELEPDVNLYVSDIGAGMLDEIAAGGASQSTLASGLSANRDIAVDGDGIVYIADTGAGTISEVPAGGGSPTTLASGLDEPTGVAVDPSGNVYAVDFGDSTVRKIPAGGGTPTTVASGLACNGIALDAAGNLYVAVTYSNAIEKIPAAGGKPVAVGSGFLQPTGVAVDSAGNVYVTDAGNSAVKKITGNTVVTLASNLSNLEGIAVDAAGNVYVAASGLGGGTDGVFEIPAGSTAPIAVGSGFSDPWGVAVKPAATPALTLAKTDNGPWRPATNATPPQYTIAVGNVGTAATSGTITVTDTLPAGLTLTATPSGSGWSCTGTAGATSFTCSSTAAIAARTGSTPATGKPIAVPVSIGATTKLGVKSITNVAYAFGGGDPQHATANSALSASDATTVELEPDVNLYVSNAQGNIIDEILAGGSSQKVIASKFTIGDQTVQGIALDGFGNVYVAALSGDLGDGSVTEIPAAGGSPIALGSFSEASDVAVDAAGNVYVSDIPLTGSIQKIPAGGGTPVTVASGFGGATGIALDAAGNLYVADTSGNAVKEFRAGTSSAVTLGFGFSSPNGVAVDGTGHVYVTDSGHGAVKVIAGSNVATLASGFSNLQFITVDTAGNVYVADSVKGAFEIPAGGHVPIAVGSGIGAPWGVAVKPAATPLLTLRKSDNGPWRPGTNPTQPQYTIAVANAGTAVTTGTITVTDTLPAGLILAATPGAQSGTSWTCTGAAGATSFSCTSTSPIGPRIGGKPRNGVPIVVPVAVGPTTKLGPKSITNVAHAFGGGDPIHATASNALSASDATTVELEPDVNLYVSDEGAGIVDEILAGGGSQNNLSSGFSDVRGIAVDAVGNVYVADLGSNTVFEEPVAGGPALTLGSSFKEPASVAVDGAGNVYVANFGGGTVQKIPAGGGTPVTVASGFAVPKGIALDAAGNLYIADTFNNAVKEFPAGSSTAITLGSGFVQPTGVAVDGNGHVYVTDSGNGAVKVIAGSKVATIASGLSTSLQQIAVDTFGNVYVGDSQAGFFEIPAGSHIPIAVGSGFTTAWGVAVKPVATPLLALHKSDNGPWRPGTNPTPPQYTIAVANAGTAVTTGTITVTDTLPAGLTLAATPAAQSGTSWTCTGAVGAISFSCTSTTPIGPRIGGKPRNGVPIVVPVAVGSTTKLGPKSITNVAHAFGGGDPIHATSNTALGASDATTVELEPDVKLYVSDSGTGNIDEVVAGGKQATLASGLAGLGSAIAVDGAGNVYVPNATSGTVTEVPADGGSPATLASGLAGPAGVAVDPDGRVYVTDTGGTILEIPAGGGTPATLASGIAGSGIALDAAGNLYVAATSNDAIDEIPAGGGTPVAVGSGFAQPTGVAVDSAGNVYVTDTDHNAVKEVTGGNVVTLASGLSNLQDIAVDTAGNVYVTRDGVLSGTNGLFEIPAGSSVPVAVGSGFSSPWGVAVEPAATPALTLAKTDNGPWRPGTNATPPQYTIAVGNAGTAATSGTITVTDTLPAGLTLTATPSGTGWSCTGTAGATSFTCTSNAAIAARTGSTPAAGQPITVPVSIGATTKLGVKSITNIARAFGGGDPQHATAATALGASDATTVELEPDVNLYVSDEAGAVDEIAAGGTSQSTLASGFQDNRNIAVDSAGNVYVPSVGAGSVSEIPAAGGTPSPLATGLNEPTGVAVDPKGNVYVTDFGDGTVQEIPAGGGTPTPVASGLSGNDIARDAAGNLYVAVTFSNAIEKIPAGSGTPVAVGSGFSQPSGVAVDSAGNVYVADSGNNAVKEITGSTVVTLASGLSNLQGIAVDAAGNVYVAGSVAGGTKGVLEIPAGSSVPIVVGSGFIAPWGVAVKPAAK
jgi:uncharacterized repeat protein (TIGR01451 family)